MEANTQQCPYCGTVNEISLARCSNCQSPLTAYAGQITGLEESGKGRLAEQVKAVEIRPPAIGAATGFNIFVALFWPLAAIIGAFASRTRVNADGTNYISAVVGSIGPIFTALVMLPLTLALVVVAWGTWTQQTWAWKANAVTIVGFALLMLTRIGSAPISLIWLIGSGALAYLWFQPRTRAWYGLD